MIVRDFLICLLQMYLLEDLEKNMLPYRRENFLGKFLVYFVIALVMLGINHLESSIFNMVMIPVTYMIVSMVVFRGNIWKKLVIVCCYYVLAIIPEFLFATLTNAYGVTGASEGFGTEIEKTLALLLMSTMTFLFIKCINQVTRKRDYLTIENKTFTVLLMLPTATIIILGCVFYSNISFEGMNRVMVPVGASLLLLTNIFIFSVFDRFVEKSEEVKKMARLYQKSRAEIANLQYMNKVNEDNRAFLHDINKFICTVAGLMEEGENQEVKEIMEHLGVRIQSLQKGVYCEHPILNSILCERKFLAESKNISYKITLGNDLRLDFLEELDMISIVGNLLDNALEAAEKTKDGRYVECRMYMGNFFSVRNGKIAEKDKKDQDWFLYPVRIKGYAAYVAAHKKEANQMGYKKDMSKYENLEGWERCGFGEQLDRWAEKYGERTAVTDSEDEISYMELKQKADCLAAAFLRKGILKGDKVLVQLPNRISFVIVFFALSKIGAVPIMMLPAHREAELEGIIELAKPAAYIVVEKYLGFSYVPMANAMKEKYSCIRHIFIDSESGDISGMIAETCGENGAFPAVDGYETAVLLLSGGTTGVPKLIPRTHTDYMYNARMSAKRCRLDSSDVYLASLPVAHNFPLCCPGLLGTLDVGGKVVLASATSPDDILDAITEEGVTITALVPAMVTVCMEMLEWDEDYDISSLRILQVGGAMLEDSLADKIIEEWPCKLMQVFGTAEGLLSFTSPEDEGSLIARCQGTPVSPADEVKIVDEEDKAVPEGVFGELLSRGPYTIDGYYMAEEANKKSFTPDGFYRTGDKAMWTKDGRLRLGGRIKEQINRAGEKIMPSEIEAYLCRHSKIKEAAVVGVPDETLGNRICAFLVTDDEAGIDLQEIHRFLREIGVAAYKMPDQIERVETWPLTSVGKIDKKALERMAQEK